MHKQITTQDPPLPITIQYIGTKELQIFKGNNKNHLAYQLLVINNSASAVRIKALRIKPFHSFIQSPELNTMFATLSTANNLNESEDPLLQPSQAGILYFFLNFKDNCDVLHLDNVNTLFFVETESQPATLQLIIPKPLQISHERTIIFSPPLRGKNYYASNGPSNTSNHRRVLITLNGDINLPQMYTIDFIQYGKDGFFQNDGKKNSDYYIYNQPIYSVADGVVIRTFDGIKENVPLQPPANSNLNTITGNSITIKLKSNHYVLYAHMIPHSLKVRVGDKVKTGQLLGHVGNSGNSGAPHLHFQITDKPLPVGDEKLPNPLNAQGRPWQFDRFVRSCYTSTGTNPDVPVPNNVIVGDKVTVYNQIVMNQNLVDFL